MPYIEAEMKAQYGDYPRLQNSHFESLAKLVEYIEKLPVKGKEHKDSWCRTTTQEALKLAKDGWKDGAEIIAAKSSQMVNRMVNRTTKGIVHEIGYDVTGAAYDPGAIALGQPEAWGTVVPEISKR